MASDVDYPVIRADTVFTPVQRSSKAAPVIEIDSSDVETDEPLKRKR